MSTRTVVAEPISSLDEKYIANSIMYDAMTATVTMFLDGDSLRDDTGRLDRENIRARLDAASWSAPALRKRLRHAPLGVSAGAWVPVDQLDLEYHVRFHPVVIANGPETIALIAGRTGGRLSRDQPPWRILFVEFDSGDVTFSFTWQHVLGDAAFGIDILRLISDHMPAPSIRAVTESQQQSIGRAPRTGVGMLAHLIYAWWTAYPTGSERWSAYRKRPLGRRFRRWGARVVRPARDGIIRMRGLADRIPSRDFRMMQFDLTESQALAQHLGGSLNDLTVAAAFRAIFDTRSELAEAALLVPISGRRTESPGSRPADNARNSVRAVRVAVRSGLGLADLVNTVHAQVRRGAAAGSAVSAAGARLGYATMVASNESERYIGTARVRSIAGWPAGDPRDDIAVLASSFGDTLTVAVSTFASTDIDAFVASFSASFVGESERA